MRLLLVPLAVLALAAPAAPALARCTTTNAPPGNSAIDQYLESVPSTCGNQPTGAVQGRPRPLRGAATRALRSQGTDGQRLAQIVAATAPPKARKAAERGQAAGAGLASPPAAGGSGDVKGRSPLGSVAHAVLTGSGGGSGMGAAFPVLLIALAAGTLVLGLRRRRPQS